MMEMFAEAWLGVSDEVRIRMLQVFASAYYPVPDRPHYKSKFKKEVGNEIFLDDAYIMGVERQKGELSQQFARKHARELTAKWIAVKRSMAGGSGRS